MKHLLVKLCPLLLLVSVNSAASETAPKQQGQATENRIDTTHRYLSNTLLYLPRTIDHFFADEQDELESNSSTFRLMLDTLFLEGGQVGFNTTLRAKMVMPHSEKRWRLSYESIELNDQTSQTEQPTSATVNAQTTRTQSAMFEAILKQTASWRASANIGLRLRSTLDPFVRLRGRKEWKTAYVKTRFTQSLFFFKSEGTGTRSILNIEHPLSQYHALQSSSSITWWRVEQPLSWNQRFSYFIKLNPQSGLAYNFSISGSDKEHYQAEQYIVDIRYREQFYRQWLFYELSPAVSYPREGNFKASHSFMLRLEILFGNIKHTRRGG